MTKIDTTILHLDALILQGFRTRKTLVWGTPVAQATRDHDTNARFSGLTDWADADHAWPYSPTARDTYTPRQRFILNRDLRPSREDSRS